MINLKERGGTWQNTFNAFNAYKLSLIESLRLKETELKRVPTLVGKGPEFWVKEEQNFPKLKELAYDKLTDMLNSIHEKNFETFALELSLDTVTGLDSWKGSLNASRTP